MIQVTVLFFATLRDHMETKQISIELPADSGIPDLKAMLVSLQPGAAAAIDSALVSINREYAFSDETIPNGAEIALFPHVSGG